MNSKTGEKINPKYENPIDNFIVLTLCEAVSNILYKYKITPNIITIVGVIFAIIGAYFLYKYNIKYFIVFNLLAYYCDCLDGYMARKYNQATKLGDYLDHITDMLQNILLIYILVKKYNLFKYKKICIISIVLFILLLITQGCQEKIMDEMNNSEILSIAKRICHNKFEKNINVLRFFGAGTYQLYVIILSYYLWSNI